MTDTPTTPKPRRRCLQFSLRTLLVLMLVFGAGSGWLAREVSREDRNNFSYLGVCRVAACERSRRKADLDSLDCTSRV